MSSHSTRRAKTWTIIVTAVLSLLAIWLLYYSMSPRRLPYADSFEQNKSGEWQAYGGIWSVRDGVMHNNSDERGARLVTGDARWRDYKLDVDLRFMGPGGNMGDVGVVVRSNDEDLGVDAYNGYYIGLRGGDNSLVMGRADHGWMETQPQPFPGGIHSLDWFHLTVVAVGCKIAAVAVDLRTNATAYAGLEESPCVAAGRIGLRSLATGGEWRGVRLARANTADLQALSQHIAVFNRPLPPQSEAEYNATHSFPTFDDVPVRALADGTSASSLQPVSTIAALKDGGPRRVTVRGVVVLTSPDLYIEDSTGGIAVHAGSAPLLNLGDEVELTGTISPRPYSAEIHDAHLRLLWDRAPLPPMSVTAAQAATGMMDGMLVEIPGHLEKVSRDNGMLVMSINDGAQSFQTIATGGDIDSLYRRLAPQSFLRLRGICVLDPRYTHSLTPFVLLLRSSDDVTLVEGPPWWSARHLMQISVALLALAFIALLIYGRIERWRLQGITQERVRLAHELHDTLAQSFAGLGFQLQGIRKGLHNPEADMEAINSQLDVACDIVRSTHEEASLSIVLLREEVPRVSDLAEALKACASQIVFGGNIAVEVLTQGTPRALSMRTQDSLFHIGREAIVNAVRHGHPSCITISLEYTVQSMILCVADDGSGFDPAESRGMGLRGIERRVAAAGLRLNIISVPEKGTRIQVEAPLNEQRNFVAWFRLKSRSLALRLNNR